MKKGLLIITAALIALTFTVRAFAGTQEEPTVTIKPPPSYTYKKILRFPLEIPSYALRVATIPLGALLRYMDEKDAMTKLTDLLSNKEKTLYFYPIVEGGAGSGFGGGVGFRHTNLFHKHYLMAGSYRIHINMSQSADLSFAKPMAFKFLGKPVSYSIGSNFGRGLQNNYFGIGNESSNNTQGLYASNNIDTGFALTYEPIGNLNISPYFGFSDGNSATSGGGSSVPSVENVFTAGELHGFGKWVNYVDFGLRIAHDTRDRLDMPEKGGVRSFTYRSYLGLNRSDYNYNFYELDVRQYIRLFIPRQVLVLRMDFAAEVPMDNAEIPFWRLTTLDVYSPLRGFIAGRFKDRASILFNAEYRYPVWKMIDGVIFYDTGRVLHTPSDMSLSHIKYSAGAGLYFKIPNLAFFKFFGAYGGEGVNFMFGAGKPI